MHCTCHRVFLASLIVAAKYLNDQSPKNKHWSAHSTVFSVGEVNLMEKQLLALLVCFSTVLFVCHACFPSCSSSTFRSLPLCLALAPFPPYKPFSAPLRSFVDYYFVFVGFVHRGPLCHPDIPSTFTPPLLSHFSFPALSIAMRIGITNAQ